jgi:hypothetical protein
VDGVASCESTKEPSPNSTLPGGSGTLKPNEIDSLGGTNCRVVAGS